MSETPWEISWKSLGDFYGEGLLAQGKSHLGFVKFGRPQKMALDDDDIFLKHPWFDFF